MVDVTNFIMLFKYSVVMPWPVQYQNANQPSSNVGLLFSGWEVGDATWQIYFKEPATSIDN